MSESAAPPMPGSPARQALAARVYEMVVEQHKTYREIAVAERLSSTSTVARLFSEARTSGMDEEIRDAELAALDAWHQRLEEAAEAAMHGDKPEALAPLAAAAAKISAERRKIRAVDVAPTLKLEHSNAEMKQMRPPWLSDELAKWKASDLYKLDLKNAGRDEGDQ